MSFREITKHLRMSLTEAVYEEMSKGMDDAHKTLLGNVIGLRTRQAQADATDFIVSGDLTRENDQLFVFQELFGPEMGELCATSELLDVAEDALNNSDFGLDYGIANLKIEYRTDSFNLPLVRSFSLTGTGINKDKIIDLVLSEDK